MSRRLFIFDHPSRCIIGAIGEYPDQSYYLQVVQDSQLVSVELDAMQLRLIAKRIDQLLDDVADYYNLRLPRRARHVDDLSPLDLPLDSEFLVGTIGLAWSEEKSAILLELLSFTNGEFDENLILSDDAEEGPDTVRIMLSPHFARQFAHRTKIVYAAGRPLCPLCGEPMDPEGHICVRLNGYRRDLGEIIDRLTDYQR